MNLKNNFSKMLVVVTSIFFASSCALHKGFPQKPVDGFAKIKFLDMYRIPNKLTFAGTKVGGLSSIDYNSQKDEYYMICDDRSAINPARYYTAKMDILNGKISNVYFTKVDSLRDINGDLYPGMNAYKAHPNQNFNTPDPEELRYFAPQNEMVWSNEGERMLGQTNILSDPSIQVIDPDGRLKYQLPIPRDLKMTSDDLGPRKNGVLEGLSFTPDSTRLFVSVEEPLYQDGPQADITDQETWCRILEYDFQKRKLLAQYAYPLGKVVRKPIPANAFKVNGISAILALDKTRLLVVERSFSIGYLQSSVRVYLSDLSQATPITEGVSLAKSKGEFVSMRKELLINFDGLGKFIDNVEGITFGPKLPNGHQTLMFITDNNFNKIEKQQVFLFELIP